MNKTCMSYWFPILETGGIPVPRTRIMKLDPSEAWEMLSCCDGERATPAGISQKIRVVDFVVACGIQMGYPLFLRTGQGSGKHDWKRTCFLADPSDAASHVIALVEWSHLVDMMGLPHNVWVCRQMLPTAPLFRCTRYGGMPVVREWRFFLRDGKVQCAHPYWPKGSLAEGVPDDPAWERCMDSLASTKIPPAWELAMATAKLFDGYWSCDVLEATNGYYVTDMAEGERSWHWPECNKVTT